jgi:hypothetical protein
MDGGWAAKLYIHQGGHIAHCRLASKSTFYMIPSFVPQSLEKYKMKDDDDHSHAPLYSGGDQSSVVLLPSIGSLYCSFGDLPILQ